MPPGRAKPDADLVLIVFPACSLGSGGSKTIGALKVIASHLSATFTKNMS